VFWVITLHKMVDFLETGAVEMATEVAGESHSIVLHLKLQILLAPFY